MFKNFLRDSIGFSLANIAIKALNIILIPIYVRYLSFEEYGIFELVTTLVIIFVVVVSLELTQAIIRFVPDSLDDKSLQNKYISSGFQIILFSSIIFIAFCSLFSSSMSILIFKDVSYSYIVRLASFIIAIQAINYSIVVIFRSQKKFLFAIRHSIIVAFVSGFFALTFLIYSGGSLRLLLIGQIIGGFLSALIGIFAIRGSLSVAIDYFIAKKMLIFSVPLILSSTAIHLSSFADRLIINDVLSLESLAIYGIAAKAASVITILLSGIQGVLSPHFISTWNTSFGLKSITRIFFIYLIFSTLILLFLKIFDDYILIFLGTSKALGGAKVLLILASASIVNGLNIFLFGLIKSLKTTLLSLIYLFTAVLNISLNYYLINIYGIEGAAFATLIAASVGFLIHFYLSSKHLKLPFSFFIPFCFIIFLLGFNIFMVT
tara:strand:+ start:17532 stop:18833 length:1302 start_codon:yes stop_codon:yes gene_type:complete